MNPLIIEALKNRCYICYAPVSGGVAMLNPEHRMVEKELQPTIEEFLKMRGDNTIQYKSSMMQGHHIFYGRVDFYQYAK